MAAIKVNASELIKGDVLVCPSGHGEYHAAIRSAKTWDDVERVKNGADDDIKQPTWPTGVVNQVIENRHAVVGDVVVIHFGPGCSPIELPADAAVYVDRQDV